MSKRNKEVKRKLMEFFERNPSVHLFAELSRFCGVSEITIKRWSKNNGMIPSGFIRLKLDHFLEVHGFQSIGNHGPLCQEVYLLGKLIAFGIISEHDALRETETTRANNLSRLIFGRVSISDQKKQKIKELISKYEVQLNAKVQTEKRFTFAVNTVVEETEEKDFSNEIKVVIQAASSIREIVLGFLLDDDSTARTELRKMMMSGATSELHETWEVWNALLSEEATKKFKNRRNRK